jgi:prevent-host-death family protein
LTNDHDQAIDDHVSRTVAVSELKTHCLRLLEEVARRRLEIVVTKRGKPIARVVPVGEIRPDEALQRLRGTLVGGGDLEAFETGAIWDAARR